jgi:hypothetical protein
VFAIENTTSPGEFPESIGNVKFSAAPPEVDAGIPEIAKYATAYPSRIFATVEVNTQDYRSAGTLAYSEINNVLDLVRFEYERRRTTIQENYLIAEKVRPGRFRIFPIPKVVPNPSVPVNAEEFSVFVQSVNELRRNSVFTDEGRDRIQSAFRLYRVGADTNIFENKLTNWWTAIEYLVKGSNGGGSIGKSVEDALVPVLCLTYPRKLIHSFKNTLVDQKVQIIDVASSQPIQLHALSEQELYQLFRCNEMHGVIIGAASDPFLRHQLEKFLTKLADPKKFNEMLKEHEQRLRWHIQRLYRARCDIVHSAERTMNAALLCANLEFYLKWTLSSLLRTVGVVRTLSGPKEFFDRQTHLYLRLMEGLEKGSEERLISLLR